MNEWHPGLGTLTEKGNMKINVRNKNEKKYLLNVFKNVCSCNQQYVLKDVCPCNQQQST